MALLVFQSAYPQDSRNLPPSGADEKTPSKSEYFSWISNTNEGSTEAQSLIFLDFFKWLHDTYGLQLDIYAFDAGNIDGSLYYGSMKSDRFKQNFPENFKNVSRFAASMGTKLGMWGGPDGFGDTPETASERTETIVSLFRDYNFGLLKLDGVCGPLRPEKYGEFEAMMRQVRHYAPDMILLNHRLQLGSGERYATTFLLGGAETYIDVFMTNRQTAPHHRAAALSRELPPNLTRLTEDHGVCLSSCLDYWDDDLILQAFNRNLILAPQIYGNPWLLRDDEFPYLAYIFNLHRKYRKILVDGIILPESRYGMNAVSRGDAATRFITLRNLSWETKKYKIRLDNEIGLTAKGKINICILHPYYETLKPQKYASEVEIEVLPFRSALVKLSTEKDDDAEIRTAAVKRDKSFIPVPRHVADLEPCPVPEDASSIYYATCYAADNNALELRSLFRSGETKIPQVKKAREAFFNQQSFIGREVWDKYLFDGDNSTSFSIDFRWGDRRVDGKSAFYLDLGAVTTLDQLTFRFPDIYSLTLSAGLGSAITAFISDDLLHWKETKLCPDANLNELSAVLAEGASFRYLRINTAPKRIAEIIGYRDGQAVERSKWHASNLFREMRPVTKAWKTEFTLDKINNGDYLCVAIDGKHGVEGAYAGFKIDDLYVGSPDRAPSFASNTWEYTYSQADGNYTYYLPLSKEMEGKKIESFVLGFHNDMEISPRIWITAYP
jgi:hypothetical protein